jgi:hypothetical protein
MVLDRNAAFVTPTRRPTLDFAGPSSARDRQGDAVMNSIFDDVRYAALARRTPLAITRRRRNHGARHRFDDGGVQRDERDLAQAASLPRVVARRP